MKHAIRESKTRAILSFIRIGSNVGLALFIAISLGVISLSVAVAEENGCTAVSGEYIIKHRRPAGAFSAAQMASIRSQARQRLSIALEQEFPELDSGIEHVRGESGTLEKLRSDPAVEYAYPNCLLSIGDTGTVSGTLRDEWALGESWPVVAAGAKEKLHLIDPAHRQTIIDLTPDIPEDLSGYWARRLEIGDFSVPPDGLVDIAIPGDSRYKVQTSAAAPTLAVLENLGDGTLGISTVHQVPSADLISSCESVKMADLDGNGHMDTVFAFNSYLSKAGLTITWRGPGARNEFISTSATVTELAVVDLNRDQLPDILVQVYQPAIFSTIRQFEYFLNRGNGTFAPRQAVRNIADRVTFGDFNGDGFPDVAGFDSGGLELFTSDGNATFTKVVEASWTELFGLTNTGFFLGSTFAPGDINSDGILDIVTFGSLHFYSSSTYEPYLFILLGGQNTFGSVYSFPFEEVSFQDKVSVRDADGDGDADILISRTNIEGFIFLENTSTGGPLTFMYNPRLNLRVPNLQTAAEVWDPFALANVPVILSGPGGTYETATDGRGQFTFHGVPAGSYTVTPILDGYRFNTLQPLDVTGGGTAALGIVKGSKQPLTPPAPPPSYPFSAPTDFGFTHLWGLYNYGQLGGTPDIDVDAPDAWELGVTGNGVTVAVIDTGIDPAHPDIRGNLAHNAAEIPSNGKDDDGNGFVDDVIGADVITGTGTLVDSNHHGSHVAGTIGAVADEDGIVGVAKGSKILPVRTGRGETLTDADVLKAYAYVISRRETGANIRVVNASFAAASKCTEFELTALRRLNDLGILFVTSAGNDGRNIDGVDFKPANCDVPNVLTVASIDRTGALAKSSNFGATAVDVAAPGVDILSHKPAGGYWFTSGTSMAAPHVSGVAALLFSARPELSAAEARVLIMQRTKPLAALAGKVASGGLASARLALKPADPPTVTPTPEGISTPGSQPTTAPDAQPTVGPTKPDDPGSPIVLDVKRPRFSLKKNRLTVSLVELAGAMYVVEFKKVAPGKKVLKRWKRARSSSPTVNLGKVTAGSQVRVRYWIEDSRLIGGRTAMSPVGVFRVKSAQKKK